MNYKKVPPLLRWAQAERMNNEAARILANWEYAATMEAARHLKTYRLPVAMRTATLEQKGEVHLNFIRAHAIWAGRQMILNRWAHDTAPPPHVLAIRDLTWSSVLSTEQKFTQRPVRKLQRTLKSDCANIEDLARHIAIALQGSASARLNEAATLVNHAGPSRDAWITSGASTWWRPWAYDACMNFSFEVHTTDQPLAAGRPSLAKQERRIEYAHAVAYAIQAGHKASSIADWLSISTTTVRSLNSLVHL